MKLTDFSIFSVQSVNCFSKRGNREKNFWFNSGALSIFQSLSHKLIGFCSPSMCFAHFSWIQYPNIELSQFLPLSVITLNLASPRLFFLFFFYTKLVSNGSKVTSCRDSCPSFSPRTQCRRNEILARKS